jgi:molybdopterin-containing oxidoreductase family iron-sulfur binding subunit
MSAEEHEHHDLSVPNPSGRGTETPDNGDNYERAYSSDAESYVAPTAHGYWRSLRELEGQGTLQTDKGGNEFPPGVVEEQGVVDPMHRRNFFQLMGASMALAGVGACRYEKEEIVPLARRPEGHVPGQAQYYATSFELGGVGHPLIATSYEGRPIQLNGNPEHPFASGGAVPTPQNTHPTRHAGTSTFAQAAILHLYDPDRSQGPQSKGAGASIEAVKATLAEIAKKPAGVRILSEATSSPTIRHLQTKLAQKGVQWHEYEPLSWDNERDGMRMAFPAPAALVRPLARLDHAETIVTIDCDIFVEHPAALRYSRDFARSRRLGGSLGPGKMNRLWSIESVLSHTGAMADHRLALRSDLGLPFAMALDAALGGGSAVNSAFLKEAKIKKYLDVLVEELQANKGKAVVIAGRNQPAAVHALVARINHNLDAVGKTLDYVKDGSDVHRPTSHLASLDLLVKDMTAGKVETLVILGGNPVYDAPVDFDFGTALGRVKTSIHLSEYVDETSQKTTWHVPRAHFLEAWGDTVTVDGTVTLAQPLIAPMFGGLSSIELLSLIDGVERTGDQLVQESFAIRSGKTDGKLDAALAGAWKTAVHNGFIQAAGDVAGAPGPVTGTIAPTLTATQQGSTDPANAAVEVTFQYSPFSYDGRYANNAWLQETPDFLSKVTWDNYAIVGPDTAKKLGIENDHMIKVSIGGKDVEVACHTMPGQARYSIALVLGGGRSAAGRVGGDGKDHRVGWNTYKVRTSAGFNIATGATVSAGSAYTLASTQEHWDIRTGIVPRVNTEGLRKRLPELVRETTAAHLARDKTWRAEPAHGYWDDAHVNEPGKRRGLSLFKEHAYTGHKWGMAIDLSTCTGCNSCMVACQAENNVPVVGRKEVMNNREMHWIRLDRYFGGTPEEPVVVHQPLPCQQCENAPCEQVCPVGATVHSDEGLNDQAYNRCIGTRYCANNCPYKVRRFNFLDWNKEWREARNKIRRLLFNPEVTVRMRGVMEKCTFCVQRIQNAKIHAKAVRRTEQPGEVNAPLPDGEIVTACQQACPTEAIVFGDLNDPNSRVSRAHEDQRKYDLLPETYTKPRNKYLARVRNPNPKLAPAASADSHGKGGH